MVGNPNSQAQDFSRGKSRPASWMAYDVGPRQVPFVFLEEHQAACAARLDRRSSIVTCTRVTRTRSMHART